MAIKLQKASAKLPKITNYKFYNSTKLIYIDNIKNKYIQCFHNKIAIISLWKMSKPMCRETSRHSALARLHILWKIELQFH